MILVLLVGPDLISQDLRFNAMPLYLSRPVRRFDYFLGKLGVIAVYLSAVMIVPVLLAFVLGFAFSLDPLVLRDTWRVLLGSLAFGAIVVVSAGRLMLAISSLSRNSRYVGAMWIGHLGHQRGFRPGCSTDHPPRVVSAGLLHGQPGPDPDALLDSETAWEQALSTCSGRPGPDPPGDRPGPFGRGRVRRRRARSSAARPPSPGHQPRVSHGGLDRWPGCGAIDALSLAVVGRRARRAGRLVSSGSSRPASARSTACDDSSRLPTAHCPHHRPLPRANDEQSRPRNSRRRVPLGLEVVRAGDRRQQPVAAAGRGRDRPARAQRRGEEHAPATGDRSAPAQPGRGPRAGPSPVEQRGLEPADRPLPRAGRLLRVDDRARVPDVVRPARRAWAEAGRESAAERALELVRMTEHADRPIRGYSKGMRQRTKLAQALVHDPLVLFLDEPLTGTDPVARRELIDLILELGPAGPDRPGLQPRPPRGPGGHAADRAHEPRAGWWPSATSGRSAT